jgi:hypothetical protein
MEATQAIQDFVRRKIKYTTEEIRVNNEKTLITVAAFSIGIRVNQCKLLSNRTNNRELALFVLSDGLNLNPSPKARLCAYLYVMYESSY